MNTYGPGQTEYKYPIGKNQFAITDQSDIHGLQNTTSGATLTPSTALQALIDDHDVTVASYGDGNEIKTVVKFHDAVTITTAENGTLGAWGGLALGTFPLGRIAFYGGQVKATGTTATAGIGATATINTGVGTTLVDGNLSSGALQTTDQNIVANAPVTLVASTLATPYAPNLVAPSSGVDGSVTALTANLNVGIVDAGSTANSTVTFAAGTEIIFRWKNIGNI